MPSKPQYDTCCDHGGVLINGSQCHWICYVTLIYDINKDNMMLCFIGHILMVIMSQQEVQQNGIIIVFDVACNVHCLNLKDKFIQK